METEERSAMAMSAGGERDGSGLLAFDVEDLLAGLANEGREWSPFASQSDFGSFLMQQSNPERRQSEDELLDLYEPTPIDPFEPTPLRTLVASATRASATLSQSPIVLGGSLADQSLAQQRYSLLVMRAQILLSLLESSTDSSAVRTILDFAAAAREEASAQSDFELDHEAIWLRSNIVQVVGIERWVNAGQCLDRLLLRHKSLRMLRQHLAAQDDNYEYCLPDTHHQVDNDDDAHILDGDSHWDSKTELDSIFEQHKHNLAALPAYTPPPQISKHITLLPHQLQGVAWLLHKETIDDQQQPQVPFYKKLQDRNTGKTLWFSDITFKVHELRPKTVRGGILADDMGMGKTIQCICLILSNPPKGITYPLGTDHPHNDHASLSSHHQQTKPSNKNTSSSSSSYNLTSSPLSSHSPQNNPQLHNPTPTITLTTPHHHHHHQQQQQLQQQQQPQTFTATLNDIQNDDTCITTLIICPVSVVTTWMEQLETHINHGVFRTLLYQGPRREEMLAAVKSNKVDILISTYGTISSEYKIETSENDITTTSSSSDSNSNNTHTTSKKRKRTTQNNNNNNNNDSDITTIFGIRFHRVILDEAHSIHNNKNLAYNACHAIATERRLCITGTPLQNKPEDIQSLFSFLRFEPLCDAEVFRSAISYPMKIGSTSLALERLRAAMCHVALRRTKTSSTMVTKLTERTIQLCSVTFSSNTAHRHVYDALYELARTIFQLALIGGGGGADRQVLKNYMSILEILLRIRMACCSVALIPKDRLRNVESVLEEVKARLHSKDGCKPLTPDEGRALFERLKGVFSVEKDAECAICLSDFPEENAVILRGCSHIFCHTCINRVLDMSTKKKKTLCPLCRQTFKRSDMVAMETASEAAKKTVIKTAKDKSLSDHLDSFDLEISPKVDALLESIEEMKSDEKGVIFSQFTGFLDIIEKALIKKGHSFTRIDGSKRQKDRITAMREFNAEKGGPRFILCSLKAAGMGINLTRANHAFLMDVWWNKAVEDQAMDRVHRIGQTRKVRVVKFIVAGSIEERIMKMQDSKAAMGKGTMESLNVEEMQSARIGALRNLFQIPFKHDS